MPPAKRISDSKPGFKYVGRLVPMVADVAVVVTNGGNVIAGVMGMDAVGMAIILLAVKLGSPEDVIAFGSNLLESI